MPGRSWRNEKKIHLKTFIVEGGREQEPWPGNDFFQWELRGVCWGVEFQLKSLSTKWTPKDRRMVGGTFIIWVLIDFLTSLLNFLQEIYGVETNVVSRSVGRGLVFFIFIFYLILFETFLAPDLCSQLLINSSYRRNHQKRLQTVWRQKLKLLAVIWFVTVLSPPSALTLFIPAFPPRVVSFAYKMMLVWLCLYCPPVPNINQFVATINLTSLKLLGNKYLGWRLSHLTTTGRIKPCWGMFQISFVVTTEYHWISIWYQ